MINFQYNQTIKIINNQVITAALIIKKKVVNKILKINFFKLQVKIKYYQIAFN